MNSGIIKANPEDSKSLNDLMRKVADEIIKQIKKEHEKYFPDSEIRNDPVIISCNAYNMTMNFTNALNNQIIGLCLDMQANYNTEHSKEKEKKNE